MGATRVEALVASEEVIESLAAMLSAVVAEGGSVGFMHPIPPGEAAGYWRRSLEDAARGGRVVLGAYLGDELAGTVTLLLDMPANQPHRAEVGKMMTRPEHRGRGVATALLRGAEAIAVERGRTLLILDTAADGGASGLYERGGYTLAGTMPGYALKPLGGLTATKLYWKNVGPGAAPPPVPLSARPLIGWVLLGLFAVPGAWLLAEISRTVGLSSPHLWDLIKHDRVVGLMMLDFTLTAGWAALVMVERADRRRWPFWASMAVFCVVPTLGIALFLLLCRPGRSAR